MSLITIPEHILYNHIKYGLSYLRDNVIASIDASNESSNTLYKLFNGIGIEKYNFYEQAKDILLRNKTNQNYLRVEIGYNAQQVRPPCIYILIPSEDMTNGTLGFGLQDPGGYSLYDDVNNTYQKPFTQTFQSSYQIMIITDNSNEVVLIYNILKCIFISLNESITLSGLKNLKLGGGDVNIKSDLVPKNMFIRALRASFIYETTSIEFDSHTFGTDITFKGFPENEIGDYNNFYYGGALGLSNL